MDKKGHIHIQVGQVPKIHAEECMNPIFSTLVERLHHGINPYSNFPQDRFNLDPFSFGNGQHEWLSETVRMLNPEVVVEVGTFLGHGARHMAATMKALPNPGALIAVDDFLSDEVLWEHHWDRLRFKNGRPEFYWTFMSNTIDAGLQDWIIPLPMSSVAASRYLNQNGVSAQLVYVDGCHHEGNVYRDLEAYWDNVLESKGIMLIDDYTGGPNNPMFGGLVRDVDKFVRERRLRPEVSREKVRLRKP